jgi:hypothetical protein
MTTRQQLFTRRGGFVANAGSKPAAKADDQHEGECMCRGCVAEFVRAEVGQAVADMMAAAAGKAGNGDDAGKRRPAAHSAPLVVHGYLAGDLEAHSSAPLMPGAYLTEARKAS